MKIGFSGGILQSIVCSGPLLFWPSIYNNNETHVDVIATRILVI